MLAETNTRFAVRPRLVLILIAAAFILPLAAAWLLVGHWRPQGMVHHGELLDPARPVPYLSVRQPAGPALTEAYLQGRWTLAFIDAGGGCGDACRQGLYNMRQVRLALGKDIDRVQTLLMTAAVPAPPLAGWLDREHAATSVGVPDSATTGFFDEAFAAAGKGPFVYLIDPLGNLVMRYGPGVSASDMLKDLERLLKYSKIG